MRFRAATTLSLALLAAPLAAQQPGKRVLTQADWDVWKSIVGTTVSPDGKWIAYSIAPQVGDGELVVRATTSATEYRVPRGYIGRPQLVPNADSSWTAPPPQWTADSRHVLALTYAPRAAFEQARRAKKKPADQPKATLAIVSVADGSVDSVQRVRSFRVPKERSSVVAILLEPTDSAMAAKPADSTARPATAVAAATPGGQPRPIAADTGTKRGKKKDTGSTLVVRDLGGAAPAATIADVMSYAFPDSGGWLAYVVSSKSGEGDGAYLREIGSGRTVTLLSGAGEYRELAFDRAGRQIAFIADRDEFAGAKPRYALYHAAVGSPAREVVAEGALGDMVVAERGRVSFTRDGNAVVFGAAPAPMDSVPADSLADKAVFDLWHWKDARLQPQQRVEASRDRDRSFTTVWQAKTGRAVRLGSDSIPRVTVSDDGRVALAVTSLPYAVESMWGEGGSDVILFDATTGRRNVIKQRSPFGATLSPGAKYVVWFDSGSWRSYDVKSGARANLTASLPVRFDQEGWDTPSTPAPWGIAGWTTNDGSLLVYDRFDVWELDPAGKRAPRNVTDGAGRRDSTVLRVVRVDEDERWIPADAQLLLRAFDDETKQSGFWRDRLGATAPPERVVMADVAFGQPMKAKGAESWVVTRGTFVDFPDLYAGSSLASLTRVSSANPQQAQYAWGSVELVKWRSDDGVPLKGLLYKPAAFDSTKQYPMVVYYYERLSDNLHQYVAPFGRNVINPTHYASNGYLIFEPDIAYIEGYPGPSALKSVVPGVQALIDRGFVKRDAIGLQGQSWGGYQTAYMITQTNMFRAAMAGAPVANMTSAYGGIRWESGLARAFQYEKGQSRIGGSVWETPMRYLENSPLFSADRIHTPLLIMSNDADGAVPWYQGIELFVALRRLNREVYLLDYNGDGHNPRKRANQLDVAMRMQQFFDHHLKGAPAPDWMERGIPFLDKGRDQLAPVTAATPGPKPATTQTQATPGTGAQSTP
ncbi:MAG: S9 family peptidase [Gemmatimonadaceae bacterium]|nr:S9 family peptidase [Gemmatimonadaceae bacterium]NUQ91362.1 S9 family peptidase [Gemmatimonadaceae bacterium]NUR18056.1 S9 family peptidase [Gemmatimonadaceae bacterium]